MALENICDISSFLAEPTVSEIDMFLIFMLYNKSIYF